MGRRRWGERGHGARREMGQDAGREEGVVRDSGRWGRRWWGAEGEGGVRMQWDKGKMWGASRERGSLALAVDGDYVGSAGEEGVMSRSLS